MERLYSDHVAVPRGASGRLLAAAATFARTARRLSSKPASGTGSTDLSAPRNTPETRFQVSAKRHARVRAHAFGHARPRRCPSSGGSLRGWGGQTAANTPVTGGASLSPQQCDPATKRYLPSRHNRICSEAQCTGPLVEDFLHQISDGVCSESLRLRCSRLLSPPVPRPRSRSNPLLPNAGSVPSDHISLPAGTPSPAR